MKYRILNDVGTSLCDVYNVRFENHIFHVSKVPAYMSDEKPLRLPEGERMDKPNEQHQAYLNIVTARKKAG